MYKKTSWMSTGASVEGVGRDSISITFWQIRDLAALIKMGKNFKAPVFVCGKNDKR